MRGPPSARRARYRRVPLGRRRGGRHAPSRAHPCAPRRAPRRAPCPACRHVGRRAGRRAVRRA
eukprot:537706-Pleurochrysis_carterae.AAC.1